VVFAGPPSEVLDQQALDQRAQQIAVQLGLDISTANFTLRVLTGSHSNAPERRARKLFVSDQLQSEGCPANATQLVVTVRFNTNNETLEKQFIEALQAPLGNSTTLTTSTGATWRTCSNAVTRSKRLTRSAPSPPGAPPPPTITSVQLGSYGTVVMGSSFILLFFVGMCGQRALTPRIRRRQQEKRIREAEAGQSLMGDLASRWGWDVERDA